MPSSLMIVALAAAWLIVLVPMVARKRQVIAHTADDAMASRIVRSGSPRGADQEESMADSEHEDSREDRYDHRDDVAELDGIEDEDVRYDHDGYEDERAERGRRYRPGRGGFDPEAAEIAAQAKYTFRQRVVLGLLATVIISVVIAILFLPVLWWVCGGAAATIAGYLGYLRRQVRIEAEIRERRLARFAGGRAGALSESYDDLDDAGYDAEYDADYEVADEQRVVLAGVERKPRPHTRAPRRNAVVVDVEDEDPAFHDLDQPMRPAYRRAVGE